MVILLRVLPEPFDDVSASLKDKFTRHCHLEAVKMIRRDCSHWYAAVAIIKLELGIERPYAL